MKNKPIHLQLYERKNSGNPFIKYAEVLSTGKRMHLLPKLMDRHTGEKLVWVVKKIIRGKPSDLVVLHNLVTYVHSLPSNWRVDMVVNQSSRRPWFQRTYSSRATPQQPANLDLIHIVTILSTSGLSDIGIHIVNHDLTWSSHACDFDGDSMLVSIY